MKYAHLAGFMSNLTATLADIDTDLPIHEEHLAFLIRRLKPDKYSYIKISDGTNIEYVKVYVTSDKLAIERAQEDTTAHAFPTGSCVSWEVTPMAVRDIVCQMPCCP